MYPNTQVITVFNESAIKKKKPNYSLNCIMKAPEPQCNFIIFCCLIHLMAVQTSATNDVDIYHHSQSQVPSKSHDMTGNQSHLVTVFIDITIKMS